MSTTTAQPTTEPTHDQRTSYALAIADRLGPGWTYQPDEDKTYPSRTIGHQDGPSIWLRFESKRHTAGRYEVRGAWPSTGKGQMEYPRHGETAPTITFDAGKSPEQAAGDIKRRFLPDYLALYAKMTERVASANDYAARSEEGIARLIALDPGNIRRSSHSHEATQAYLGSNYHGYTITVNGGSVRFEHFDVPLEVALRIVPLLKKASQPEEED